jgi:hypothetical protein
LSIKQSKFNGTSFGVEAEALQNRWGMERGAATSSEDKGTERAGALVCSMMADTARGVPLTDKSGSLTSTMQKALIARYSTGLAIPGKQQQWDECTKMPEQ